MKIHALSSTVAATMALCSAAPAAAVYWTDWTSGSPGPSGSAAGTINTPGGAISVSYSGEIHFIQTIGGTNYWNPSAPYISGLVDNAPPTSDIITLNQTTAKTLTFSQPVDNLFFAVVSLNGNGYVFNRDFEIVSGNGIGGYWGAGTFSKTDLGGGIFRLNGSGEPHGVIRFTGTTSTITWTSASAETWNGFTVGTYGIAPPTVVPEPAGAAGALAAGLFGIALTSRRRRAAAR